MSVLSSGHLFHELSLRMEFSQIAFTLILVCYLGNISISFEQCYTRIIISLASQECTRRCKSWKLIFVVVVSSN